ncbi:MAG: hypothetical protein AAGE65_06130 [Planctomycetota bacterium]
MGWFLPFSLPGSSTSKKGRGKGKSKGKGRGKKKNQRQWDPQRTLAGLKVLGIAAAVVGAGVAWTAGQSALVGYAQEHRSRPVTPADVTLLDAPPWVAGGKIEQRLKDDAAQRVKADPFDAQGLMDAAAVLTLDPWVAEVNQVRRTPDGVIVEAEYREPLAMVKARDGFHIVDTQGVRLAGPAYWQALEPAGLPLITNVTVAPPGELGLPWEGAEIEAGVELVKLLKDEPFAPQILAYDVGQRDPRTGKLALVLQTDGGGVVWGRPPGDAWSVAEVSTQEKIDRLRRIAESYAGRIDMGMQTVLIYTERVQNDRRPIRRDDSNLVRPTDIQHAAGR